MESFLSELENPLVQKDIIEYCDNNLEIINNLKKTIENNKKMMKELF